MMRLGELYISDEIVYFIEDAEEVTALKVFKSTSGFLKRIVSETAVRSKLADHQKLLWAFPLTIESYVITFGKAISQYEEYPSGKGIAMMCNMKYRT